MKEEKLNFWHIPLGMIMAVAFLALLMCSCKSVEYVPVVQKETHTDSIYLTKVEKDSVWLHDSILVKDRGDTVLIEKWHTKYIEKLRIDTTYIAKVDSIPVPYPVEKLVEKKLSKGQMLRLALGDILMFGVCGVLVFFLVRLWLNRNILRL
jgi:hypothetical protein